MRDLKITDESEIAEVAKIFLELNNWKTYPEVVTNLFNGRPDYIAVKGALCKVVECKKTLSYPVIEQLARWQIDAEKRKEWQKKGYEHEIAIPHLLAAFVERTHGGLSDLKKLILEDYRIGVYSITKRNSMRSLNRQDTPYFCSTSEKYWCLVLREFEYEIRLDVSPKIQPGSRETAHRLIDALNDDMCCTKAGLKGGKADYMTPFKRTMNRVKALMSDGKERHIQSIINEIKPLGGHHYCSDHVAMASIAKFIDKFGIAKRTKAHGAWFQVKEEEATE